MTKDGPAHRKRDPQSRRERARKRAEAQARLVAGSLAFLLVSFLLGLLVWSLPAPWSGGRERALDAPPANKLSDIHSFTELVMPAEYSDSSVTLRWTGDFPDLYLSIWAGSPGDMSLTLSTGNYSYRNQLPGGLSGLRIPASAWSAPSTLWFNLTGEGRVAVQDPNLSDSLLNSGSYECSACVGPLSFVVASRWEQTRVSLESEVPGSFMVLNDGLLPVLADSVPATTKVFVSSPEPAPYYFVVFTFDGSTPSSVHVSVSNSSAGSGDSRPGIFLLCIAIAASVIFVVVRRWEPKTRMSAAPNPGRRSPSPTKRRRR